MLRISTAFLVNFTDPSNQLFNVKSVFVFLNCGPSVLKIYACYFLLNSVIFIKLVMNDDQQTLEQNCCLI